MHSIAFKLQALKLLESMNDTKRTQLLAFDGNKKLMKMQPGGRHEVFPHPSGLVQFINELRDAERGLTIYT
ncbi:hypothetical protein H257_16455 [Aphanomyces astaci]|uniref:Uncharacterized protein n=1 Tax=Aphanomyces astaci TaxID=112090 RepID=W4FIQ1_APHAT|nr:hypothetical protein H257_16455 [Aphanomyces astaci]ETV67370.1 hypothetical protein H257_16455 [Aphanomyces astaci]|eukprot:XP_009843185.1 hypothetical protein H257_16455 [Aphanomyces astaci]